MKKIRTGLFAVVIAAGVFGAFAFTKAEKKEGEAKAGSTTYYAVRIPGTNNFRWTSDVSELEDLECLPLANASCSVIANAQPDNNQNPDPTPDNVAYQQP